VVTDAVDPVADERLARFVVASHVASHPANEKKPMEEREAAAARMHPTRKDVSGG
jgi:DNA replicative helicase MCM subunit Mcm2 (Cdc46/Mcm family)